MKSTRRRSPPAHTYTRISSTFETSAVQNPESATRLKLNCVMAFAFMAFSSVANAAGLANSGFEVAADLDAQPTSWIVDASANAVIVVDAEDGSDFQVYGPAGANLTVAPYRGNTTPPDQMLRIGTPESPGDQNNNQNDGSTAVSQTFEATSTQLALSTRVFTTEFRNNRDAISFQLVGSEGENFPIAGANGTDSFSVGIGGTCTETPCTFPLDAGRNGQIFAGEWTEYRISGLTPGNSYTLRYELITGGGSSHPSWAYFDDVNQPPIAAFTCNPTVAYEGDFVGCDARASMDPDGDAITYSWAISGAGLPAPISLAGPIAGFYAAQDGQYEITLAVDDGNSSSTATTAGDLATAPLAPTDVQNAPPLVSAINIETLGEATLRCRGVDVGAADTHSASFSVAGSTGPVIFEEENDPAYATFVATASFSTSTTGPASLSGTCTISEETGGNSTTDAAFTIEVLDPETLLDRFEPNDSSDPEKLDADVPTLKAGWTRLALLETADDVDFYELRMEDGTVPPVGAEFLVRIKMPADYDAVLLSRPIAGQQSTVFESAPFVSFPFVSFPFVSFPFVSFPFVSFPFVSFPAQTAPFVSFPFVSFPFVSFPIETSPFVSFAFKVADFPLSQMVDAPSGNDASGDILGLGELGSLNITTFEDENLRVKDLSANFDNEETLFGVRTADEEALFLAVVSFDGVLSPEPYEITVEASRPLDAIDKSRDETQTGTEQLLGLNCEGTPLVDEPAPAEVLHSAGTPRTLIITQRQRLQELEGLDDLQFEDFVSGITTWLDRDEIAARFVSVPSDLGSDAGNDVYATWDENPCNIEPLREVAKTLGSYVRSELSNYPTIDNVIILGDIDTFPSDIQADLTAIGNEALFGSDLPVRPDSPLAAVFRAGQYLTDACYTDFNPIEFNGGLFCIEDLPTGRLTTTTRLAEEAASFNSTGGLINFTEGLVTGYEFFSDVADSMTSSLEKLGPVNKLNNEFWSSDGLNGLESAWCEVPGPNVSSVQGHASFNAILAADGFNKRDFSDITTVSECLDNGAGGLVASIGCHTLTPVPSSATPPQEFFAEDPSITWSDRRGTWVGTYAFGLGHTDTDELGTEGILKRFFSCLGDNGDPGQSRSVGQCLIQAKTSYLQSRTSVDAYDVKSVMTLAISGIPQVTVVPAEAAAIATSFAEALSPAGTPAGTFDLTVTDGGSVVQNVYPINLVTTGSSSYFTVNDQYQAGTGRPFLPTLEVSSGVVPANSNAARSISLREGDYQLLIGFDPLISNLKTEWVDPANIPESKACVRTMAPTEIGVINQLPVNGQLQETFNLTTAQFECSLSAQDQGRLDTVGTSRKFERLDVELRRPPAGLENDLNPPNVTRRDIIANATTGDALAIVDAEDENDISEINVLVYDEDRVNGGPGTVTSYSTGNILGQDGPFEVMLPGGAGKFIAIEYFDGANNKILKSAKGILVEAVEVVIRASTYTLGQETLISVEIERLEEFLNQGITLTIDFDGVTQVFALGPDLLCSNTLTTDCITILPDGSGVFETSYLFTGSSGTVTVTATVRGAASGYDEAVLGRCEDIIGDQANPNGDLAQCSFSASGTNVDIDLYVDGVISDDFKYRVRLLGTQFQYTKGKLSRPAGVQGSVTLLGDSGLRFSFDAGDLGWNGVTPLEIEQSTQDGIKGGAGQGTTDVNTFTASGGAPGV